MKEKENLVEFYIHNLTLTNMIFWNPNAGLGDTQLMALTSWMTHEDARAKEVKRVMKKEEKEPLYIKEELVTPRVVIRNHGLISYDAPLAPKYLATQEQAIIHFEDTFRLLGTKCLQAF